MARNARLEDVGERNPKLKFVKYTRSHGRLFCYFYMGMDENGKRVHVPLPEFDTPAFYVRYASLLATRPSNDGYDGPVSSVRLMAEHRKARNIVKQTKTLPQQRKCYIYFIGTPSGHAIKIGRAEDIQRRIAHLQIAHPEPLSLLAAIEGNAATERAYHKQFREHKMSGEWFASHPDILAEIDRIKAAEQNVGLQSLVQAE